MVLVLEHLPLPVAARFRQAAAIASATARCLLPLVVREDLIQVAREALAGSTAPAPVRGRRSFMLKAAASA